MAGNQHAAQVIKTEEKGSDVNLAVHLLNDSWLDVYDCAVVVSNDSDIAEAMRLARHHHGKLIGLITPLFGTKWGFPRSRCRPHTWINCPGDVERVCSLSPGGRGLG